MSQIISMLAPFVLTGIIFTIAALAWARHKQRQSDERRNTPQSAKLSDQEGDQ